MKAGLTDTISALRRDRVRALTITCLLMLALAGGSYAVACGTLVVAIVLCTDALQVQRATDTLRAIAEGDRFVAFPANWLDAQPCTDIACAGERMRRDLIEADAAIADQRRLLAEARIRRDGASFFTTRFHESVAQAFSTFAQRGDEICATVDELDRHNAGLLQDANIVSHAVAVSAGEIRAVSQAAAQIAEIVAGTTDQIAASKHAGRATLADLQGAKETIDRLKHASHEITTIMDIIRSVATQTSLLALTRRSRQPAPARLGAGSPWSPPK